jgi:hypothetical protein
MLLPPGILTNNFAAKLSFMQRFNIFNQIHKGLRVLLYDTATFLQQTDFSNAAQCRLALEKIDKVIYTFMQHGKNEDEYILPLVKRTDVAVADSFEEEHEADETIARDLKRMMDHLMNSTTTENQKEAGQDLCYAFNEFVAFNLYHMNKEEKLLNPILWDHFTDEDIREINMRVVEKIAPEEHAFAGYWMMRGLNNDEIIQWLTAVKAGGAEHVLQGLVQIADLEFPAQRAGLY